MRIGCWDEYSRLKTVMLATPEPGSFTQLSDAAKWDFQDIPDWDKVRWEVDQYIQLLVSQDVYVLKLPYDKFPNQIFLRDLALVLGEQVILANPARKARKGEENILEEALSFLLAPQQKPTRVTGDFEAADVLLNGNQLLAACGNRTSAEALWGILGLSPQRTLSIIKALPEGVPQHLLGHKHIVGRDWLLSRNQLNDETFGIGRVTNVQETVEVVDRYAMNIVTLGPGTIIMPDNCPRTKELYEREGLICLTTPISEITKMGGSLACMTLPLLRSG